MLISECEKGGIDTAAESSVLAFASHSLDSFPM